MKLKKNFMLQNMGKSTDSSKLIIVFTGLANQHNIALAQAFYKQLGSQKKVEWVDGWHTSFCRKSAVKKHEKMELLRIEERIKNQLKTADIMVYFIDSSLQKERLQLRQRLSLLGKFIEICLLETFSELNFLVT